MYITFVSICYIFYEAIFRTILLLNSLFNSLFCQKYEKVLSFLVGEFEFNMFFRSMHVTLHVRRVSINQQYCNLH